MRTIDINAVEVIDLKKPKKLTKASVKTWKRSQIKQTLEISESTLKRLLSLLTTHLSDFQYTPYQRRFTHSTYLAIRALVRGKSRGKTYEETINRLKSKES